MVLFNYGGNSKILMVVFSFLYAGNDYWDTEGKCSKNSPGTSTNIDIAHGKGALLRCKGGGCIIIDKVIYNCFAFAKQIKPKPPKYFLNSFLKGI